MLAIASAFMEKHNHNKLTLLMRLHRLPKHAVSVYAIKIKKKAKK